MIATNKSIMIRVDGSSHIGIGHIMRCLTLAIYFKDLGFSIDFFSIFYNETIRNKIISEGFNVFDLPDIKIENHPDMIPLTDDIQLIDSENCKNIISNNYTFIIVDNYRFGRIWEKSMISFCKKMIVIDDLANREHHCDYLIDQNIGRKKSQYIDLVDNNTKLMLGVRYAMLRQEFKNYISGSKNKRKKTKNIEKILICFGGGDTSTLVIQSTDAVIDSGYIGQIHIVISSNCSRIESIKNKYNKYSNIVIDVDLTSMPLAMYQADLSIGAFGSMSWERCCLGLPSISIQIAENQKYIAQTLDDMGVTIKSSIQCIADNIKKLFDGIHVSKAWHDISNRSYDLCDGLGVERIALEVNKK